MVHTEFVFDASKKERGNIFALFNQSIFLINIFGKSGTTETGLEGVNDSHLRKIFSQTLNMQRNPPPPLFLSCKEQLISSVLKPPISAWGNLSIPKVNQTDITVEKLFNQPAIFKLDLKYLLKFVIFINLNPEAMLIV